MEQKYVTIDQALQRFGLNSFRPGQREVIEAISAGSDCLCVMPTGGGKSLCYQLPSLIRPGLTIVVSPLIALMKDQVDSLGRNGIPAALINSTLTHSEQQARLLDVAAGKYQLVYVAPERLRNPRFLEAIRATPIQLLAIDEAHCISQWGHDFRPDYTRIGQFREWLGGVQTVALTATATPRVRQDIMDVLGLKKPKQFMSGFARPNLHFGVLNCQSDREKEEELGRFLKTNPGAGIIYSATRKRCEALVDWIGQTLKIPVGAYHAGLQQEQRRVIQERFMSNQLRLIVATNAFGMGIDKSDLRFVIHYNMPGSLEAYYQEAGRAGRDGKDSVCVMLYSMQDRYIQEYFIENNYPPRDVIQSVYEFLQSREEDPIELTLEEIRDQMGASVTPEAIGSCLQILSRTRVLERFEAGGGLALVRINCDLPTLVDMFPAEAKVRRQVLRVLERAVGDRRYEEVYVHPRWLLQESGLERDSVARALREIAKLPDVDYIPPFRGRAVHFRQPDIPFDKLDIDFEALRKRMEAEYDRLNQVVQFAQSPICRQATILNYFGDPEAKPCGQCDRCGRKAGWPSFDLRTVGGSPQQTAQQVKLAVEAGLSSSSSKSTSSAKQLATEQKVRFLVQVLDAIARVHGRLGKHLIVQYLCGSSNSKVQKLNLHRLSGFGMLKGFRQDDGIELLDNMLGAGLLLQQEVNRHRPTVSVSPHLSNPAVRDDLLGSLEFSPLISAKIVRLLSATKSEPPSATASPTANASPTATRVDRQSPSQPKQSAGSVVPNAASATHVPKPQLVTAAQLEAANSIRPESSRPVRTNENSPLSTSGTGRNNTADETPVSHSVPVRGLAPKPTGTPAKQVVRHETMELGLTESVDAEPASQPDWHWSIEMFQKNFDWQTVLAIRQMSDQQLAASLCSALAAGEKVDRAWLVPIDGDQRTAGQQRVVRELQRRTNAGV